MLISSNKKNIQVTHTPQFCTCKICRGRKFRPTSEVPGYFHKNALGLQIMTASDVPTWGRIGTPVLVPAKGSRAIFYLTGRKFR